MNADFRIDRPIFIVGSGRSGTTILYNLLCGHPDLAWFSNYSQRWPKYPQLALLSRLYLIEPLRRCAIRGLPIPAEAHALWDYCKPVSDSPGDPPLTEDDAAPEDIARTRKMVALYIRYQGKPRFINKNTRNTRRIRFLNRIFEDALFLHVIRDPRATIASFLKVGFWPDLKIWCCDKVTPREWEAQGKDPVVLAANLWVGNVQRVLDDKVVLSEERYMEVYYEDLVATPKDVLSEILTFSGLEWSDRFGRFVDSFELRNMNFKYKTQFSDEQLAKIEGLIAPLAQRLGYELSSPDRLAHPERVQSCYGGTFVV